MALKAKLDKIDDLDESVQALYRQEGDSFVVDVEAVEGWALEDVGGLRKALKTERTTAKELDSTLSQYKLEDGTFMDGEAAAKALVDVVELGKLDPEADAAKIADRKIAEARTIINTEWAAKEATWTAEREVLIGAASRLAANTDVDLAIGHPEVRGIDKILKPILMPHVGVRQTDEGFKTFVKDPNNPSEARMGPDGSDMTLLQLAQELKQDKDMSGAFRPPERKGEAPRNPHNPRTQRDDDEKVTGASRIARGLEQSGLM